MKSRVVTAAGFSLIEVMVSMIVISIGLLGIAKIQAIAYGETATASVRSLAAVEAAGMASAMRADRAYWSIAGSTTNLSVTVPTSPGTITANDPNLSAALGGAVSCLAGGANAPCTTVNLAAYDLQQWQTLGLTALPGSSAIISCPTGTTPITCTVQVTWNERTFAANSQGTNTGQSAGVSLAGFTGPQSYTLYVEP